MSEVIIVGGGLSGLCCAQDLHRAGIPFTLLEASDAIGGRIRTDSVEGFLLDRGFQVFLTSYPEPHRRLDYKSLELGTFSPGALIRWEGKFHRFADPWRQPQHLFQTLASPVATFRDKIGVAKLRRQVCQGELEDLFNRAEQTTLAALQTAGFSARIIDRFFKPFLGGVFLERELETSSRMFEFVMRMFSTGDATLPAHGMQAIPDQLAASLPKHSIRLNTAAAKVDEQNVVLASGEVITARAVVLATPATVTANLLHDPLVPTGRGVYCYYFAAERPPLSEPVLVLNGDDQGPIQNACVPSQVCPSYAPAGQALVSVSVLDDHANDPTLLERVIEQLHGWFGDQVGEWSLLRQYRIPFALPNQAPPALSPIAKPFQRSDWLYVCGDHMDTASIQGAMISGRRVGQHLITKLGFQSNDVLPGESSGSA